MAYSPDVEYPLETLLAGMSEKVRQRRKDRVRAASMHASKAVRQVASVEHLSQSGAKFADRRLGGLEQRRAQPKRDTPHVCEPAWLHADLKVEVYIPLEHVNGLMARKHPHIREVSAKQLVSGHSVSQTMQAFGDQLNEYRWMVSPLSIGTNHLQMFRSSLLKQSMNFNRRLLRIDDSRECFPEEPTPSLEMNDGGGEDSCGVGEWRSLRNGSIRLLRRG